MSNLEHFPFRVICNATWRLQAGGTRTADELFCCYTTLAEARLTRDRLRSIAEQGEGLHFGQVLNSARINFTHTEEIE